ncbi:MAG: glycosyltransferase [Bryobacteraceae bacterium]
MQPFISVIIPTFNRPAKLEQCLQAIESIRFSRDGFEVIVVDDGSPQPLDSVAVRFASRLPVRMIRQANAGPAAARNAGLAAARGEIAAFTDDDCYPAEDWLEQLQAVFARSPGVAVAGRVVNALPGNVFSNASQLLLDYLYDYFNIRSGKPCFFTSNNIAFPAEALRRLGGFDTTFPLAAGEDRELCDRWVHHGFKFEYAPEALVYHAHYLGMKAFLRQHFNYGRGAYFFHKSRENRGAGPFKVEPLPFYGNLLLYPFRSRSKDRPFATAFLFATSQLATAAGFFRQTLVRAGSRV